MLVLETIIKIGSYLDFLAQIVDFIKKNKELADQGNKSAGMRLRKAQQVLNKRNSQDRTESLAKLKIK